MKKRYSEEQIIGFLREAENGLKVKDLCRPKSKTQRRRAAAGGPGTYAQDSLSSTLVQPI